MRFFLFFKQVFQDSLNVSWTLFRVMIPTILVLKVIEEAGGIVYLSQLLNPVMSVVGLPSELGVVWATTLLVNIYSGLLVLINLNVELSVAQASVLGTMMLLAHALPVEGVIARQAGVSLWVTVLVRVGGSLLLGWLLYHGYSITGWSQQAAPMLLQPGDSGPDIGMAGWLVSQIKNLAMIYLVLTSLLLALRIMKLLGIEAFMSMALRPLLKFLGISRDATSLTIVGISLGLSYGGGLLIEEARKGQIQPRDIFCSIMLLNLLHSIIEDTLLILLIGADLSAILWGRMIFSVFLVSLISVCMRVFIPDKYQKYFYCSVSAKVAVS